MKRFVYIGLIGLLFVFHACEKDPEWIDGKVVPGKQGLTPYTLNVPDYFPEVPALGIDLTEEGVSLGRKLFYDPILSADSTQSCGTCHNQKFGFTDNGFAVSTGIDGIKGTRNSMPIMNLAWNPNFFWDGRSASIQDQALEPVPNPIEMHLEWPEAEKRLNNHSEYVDLFAEVYGDKPIDRDMVADAISQFELTLISANTEVDDAFERSGKNPGLIPPFDNELVALGYRVFITEPSRNGGGGDCFHCHSDFRDGGLFTNHDFANNGLDANPNPGLMDFTGNPLDKGKFKIPSLRNVEYTAPYMHDGRYQTLEQVVNFYNDSIQLSNTIHPIMVKDTSYNISNGLNLTDRQKEGLVAFLKALSDKEFIENPDFAPPEN